MRYRELGRSGIKVSEIGFGCWTMGGPNWSSATGQAIGWPEVDEAEVLAAIKVGLDAGVNHWDNADNYGNGRAERMLGACLRKLGVKREGLVIASKTGHFRGTAIHAFDPRHIRNQCEQSLRNLGVDHIDLYYFHHGSYVGQGYNARGEIVADHDYLHEAAATMHALRKEGKVRAIGQSAYSHDDFERAVPVLKPDALQTKANLRFDEFIRQGSRTQALMEQYGCTLVAFGPLDQGILLGKFDPERPPSFEAGDSRRNRKDFDPATLRSVSEKLSRVRARFGISEDDAIPALSSIASRWLLAHDRVCSAIPGFRNDRQARANLRAMEDAPMSQGDAQWLRELFRS